MARAGHSNIPEPRPEKVYKNGVGQPSRADIVTRQYMGRVTAEQNFWESQLVNKVYIG